VNDRAEPVALMALPIAIEKGEVDASE